MRAALLLTLALTPAAAAAPISAPAPSAYAALPCPSDALAPGRHVRTTIWQGEERWYEVAVPPAARSGGPLPVVLNLHPFVLGGNPLFRSLWRRESGLHREGRDEGFIVIQPEGTGSPTSWNGGEDCCGDASNNNVDDVGYMRHLIEITAGEACVDEARVYATGMSNGGYLSHRLACEASDFVAAIAPVVGSLSRELECAPERAVPVIQISGSEDNLDSRAASVARWVEINDCDDAPEVSYQKGAATCETWTQCRDGAEVTHCVVEGGGHCWFSDLDPQASPGCYASDDLISQAILWDFVSRWSLP